MKKPSKPDFILIAILLLIGFYFGYLIFSHATKLIDQKADKIQIEIEHESQKLNAENVYQELMRNDVKFADIVLRQACLESGWFTSYNCLERNNLFGMKGGKKSPGNPNGYAIYDNWKYSVRAYKRWQRRMYGDSNENYYSFLERIGYAESSEYIDKLKKINIIIIKK